MMFLGSAVSALDILNSLKDLVSSGGQSGSGSGFAVDDTSSDAKTTGSTVRTGVGPVSTQTMHALLTLQAKTGGAGGVSSQLFARLDRDGSGRISKSELDDVLNSLGPDPNAKSSSSLFSLLDTDQDGEVSGDEFMKAFSRQDNATTTGVRPDASTQELFQRLLQQQTQMVANLPTGQAVAQLV